MNKTKTRLPFPARLTLDQCGNMQGYPCMQHLAVFPALANNKLWQVWREKRSRDVWDIVVIPRQVLL